jgi:dTDP-4-amino-4,6-dideoxygalactose transaminase
VPGALHLHESTSGYVGINSRLDAVQALVVTAHLADLSARVERRRQLAAAYDQAVPDAAQTVARGPGHPVHQYVLRSRQREALIAHLDAAGIDSAIYYPRSLASQPAIAPQPATPVADRWAVELLALPCHVGITDESADRICDALASFKS